MKIWTKRAAGVGAIIGGLLVAGTVAASASDLPLLGNAVSSVPVVGPKLESLSADPLAATNANQSASSRHSGTAKTTKTAKNNKNSKTDNTAKTDKTAGASSSSNSKTNSHISGIANANSVGVDVDGVTLQDLIDLCGNVVAVASDGASGECPEEGGGGSNPNNGGSNPHNSSMTNSDISGILNANDVHVGIGKIVAQDLLDLCGNNISVASTGGDADC